MQYTDIHKMDCITNITMMQDKIGTQRSNVEWLLKNKTFDELFEMQNGLIEHYNQAIKNAKEITK